MAPLSNPTATKSNTTKDLREEWDTLYKQTLPTLAITKSPFQPTWPVHLDHCFARIILDNAIGITKPWPSVLKSPAVKFMSEEQYLAVIALGERIASGELDLVELNERSLEVRGKKGRRSDDGAAWKRKVGDENGDEESGTPKKVKTDGGDVWISKYFLSTAPPSTKALEIESSGGKTGDSDDEKVPDEEGEDIAQALDMITTSTLTPFRKKVLTLLCQVPRGHYTTYAAISNHISSTSPSKTCARAVGNAMRNNPFAPVVPCHRVLATGGKIGGFGGEWGEDGKFAGKKIELLREEGVRFDGKGKVVGSTWTGFH